MAKYLWADLRWPEFEELDKEKTVVIVPVGSIEQHGPHLPISTDSNLVTEIGINAAKNLQGKLDVLVTPTVWAGFSPHHMAFPGAISLSANLFSDLLNEICNCIYHHGFKRILLMNSHGGNATFLKIASARMGDKSDCIVGALCYWDLVKTKLSDVVEDGPRFIPGHGGEFETSLQMILASDLVEESLVSEAEVTTEIIQAQCSSAIYSYRPMKYLTSKGQLGNSSKATKEKGTKILSTILQELEEFLIDFSTWPIPSKKG